MTSPGLRPPCSWPLTESGSKSQISPRCAVFGSGVFEAIGERPLPDGEVVEGVAAVARACVRGAGLLQNDLPAEVLDRPRQEVLGLLVGQALQPAQYLS